VLGKKQNGKRDYRLLGEGYPTAVQFKELWNAHVGFGNIVHANGPTTHNALRTALASEMLKETAFDMLNAVEFFLNTHCLAMVRSPLRKLLRFSLADKRMLGIEKHHTHGITATSGHATNPPKTTLEDSCF
jgi:hypothetical protein